MAGWGLHLRVAALVGAWEAEAGRQRAQGHHDNALTLDRCASNLRTELTSLTPSPTEVVRLALAQAANHAMSTSNRLADEGGAAKGVASVAEQAVGNALLNAAAAIGWAVQEGTVPDPLSPPRGWQ